MKKITRNKIVCPVCGNEIAANQINLATEVKMNSNKKKGGIFLGIIPFEEAIKNDIKDTFYYCPICEVKFFLSEIEGDWKYGSKRKI